MPSNAFDFADNNLNTESVVKNTIKELEQKYNREFEVLKVGERYGTGFTNEITVLCTITGFYDFIFRVTYNMLEEKIVNDNFLIRCTCYYVEKELNKILKNVNSIVRVEIERKNGLNKVYKTQDFLLDYPDDYFIATMIVEKHNSNNFEEVLKELNNIYDNIKLKTIIYEMNKEEFEKFNKTSKNIDYFAMRYIEGFNIVNKQIFKLENGKIEEI